MKMHQGHHGANHPVKDVTTGKVEITSMNHGFAVDEDTLPKNVDADPHLAVRRLELRHRSSTDKPVFSVQYHPGGLARPARLALSVPALCRPDAKEQTGSVDIPRATIRSAAKPIEPLAFLMFADDGVIPNNLLPLLYYRDAVDLSGTPESERVIETLFKKTAGRQRIMAFTHTHHHRNHEGMGDARPRCCALQATKGRNSTSSPATWCSAAGRAPAINVWRASADLNGDFGALICPMGATICAVAASRTQLGAAADPVPLPGKDPVYGVRN